MFYEISFSCGLLPPDGFQFIFLLRFTRHNQALSCDSRLNLIFLSGKIERDSAGSVHKLWLTLNRKTAKTFSLWAQKDEVFNRSLLAACVKGT